MGHDLKRKCRLLRGYVVKARQRFAHQSLKDYPQMVPDPGLLGSQHRGVNYTQVLGTTPELLLNTNNARINHLKFKKG